MGTTFLEFDGTRDAIINPPDGILPVPDFPKLCVSTFSSRILDQYTSLDGVERIGGLLSTVEIPIYKIRYKGRDIAFYQSLAGAPACAAGVEEIIALGAKKYVLFGTCGVLDAKIPDGGVIVPTAAVRDEGTSYHYVENAPEIAVDPRSLRVLEEVLKQQGVPYVKGKTWTTDAIYRETRGKMEDRKQCGCVAVAAFRGFPFAQFYMTLAMECAITL